eukprot:TRINITY_DN3990_c0_g1_i1.p1 TRINITY_DN3990_c0_g1~~TRINITY_DN3990_c0_g1_i1.p1  ORF type:complete len:347 (+),score=68.84 TRINITY_DN3990_c0_g1_i1:226-1266(+)
MSTPDWFRLGHPQARRYFPSFADDSDKRLGLDAGDKGSLVGQRLWLQREAVQRQSARSVRRRRRQSSRPRSASLPSQVLGLYAGPGLAAWQEKKPDWDDRFCIGESLGSRSLIIADAAAARRDAGLLCLERDSSRGLSGLRRYPWKRPGSAASSAGHAFGADGLWMVPDGCCWRQADAAEKEAALIASTSMAPAEGASTRPIRGESAKAFAIPQKSVVPDGHLYADAELRSAVHARQPTERLELSGSPPERALRRSSSGERLAAALETVGALGFDGAPPSDALMANWRQQHTNELLKEIVQLCKLANREIEEPVGMDTAAQTRAVSAERQLHRRRQAWQDVATHAH